MKAGQNDKYNITKTSGLLQVCKEIIVKVKSKLISKNSYQIGISKITLFLYGYTAQI